MFLSLNILFFDTLFARAWSWDSWWWGDGTSAIVMFIGFIYLLILSFKREKLRKKAMDDLVIAKSKDPTWNEDILKEIVKNTFFFYQEAWAFKDLSSLNEYLTDDYLSRANEEMNTILAGRKNIIKDPKISFLHLMYIGDREWQEGDIFIMEVNASMIDYIVSETTGEFIKSTLFQGKNELYEDYKKRAMVDSQSFTEYWVFIRVNWEWQLNDIKEGWFLLNDMGDKMTESEIQEVLRKESI